MTAVSSLEVANDIAEALADILALDDSGNETTTPKYQNLAVLDERVRTMDATQPGIYGRAVMDTLVHLGLAERPI